MDRRDFLKASVLSATAGLAIDACAPESDRIIPVLIPEEPFVPGEESWLPSTCFECSAGCGILVRKIDARLVKVEGDPEDPSSRGGVCARGQTLPQAMYHPDRIQGPLLREGDRGSGSWKKASWDEALDRIVSELTRDRSFGFITGSLSGHRGAMVGRFVTSLGGWHFLHEPFTTAPLARAQEIATGQSYPLEYDIASASYVISFGAEVLESHTSPVRFARDLAEMRQGRPGRRGKFVMVGPRLSLTAANADEWIPARPGAELELALALSAVLFEQNLYDPSCVGFTPFRDFVLERAKPAEVAGRTGIRLERIEKIARELAAHRPSVALAGGTPLRSRSGVALALAVSHLNALLGARGSSGTESDFAEWSPLSQPAKEPTSLAAELRAGTELPRVLFVADANPMHSLPSSFGLGARLSQASLVVSFASFPDETQRVADVVLPESMSFERHEDAMASSSARLSGPLLIRPLYDTRSMPDSLIAIAKRAGAGESFPWDTYEQALGEAWSSPAPASRILATKDLPKDLRYQFAVEPIGAALGSEPASGLQLHVYASTPFGDGRSAHIPFLQDLADPVTGIRWGSVIEIAESDAKPLGIRSGDLVELSAGDSGKKSVRAPAFVSPMVHPGVVAIAAGQGHTAYGRYAEGRGVNVYSLLDDSADEDGFFMIASELKLKKKEGAG